MLTLFGWQVLDKINSESDHSYIEFQVSEDQEAPSRATSVKGWAFRKLSKENLERYISEHRLWTLDQEVLGSTETADLFNDYLVETCDACMPCRSTDMKWKPIYWRTTQIVVLRSSRIVARSSY